MTPSPGEIAKWPIIIWNHSELLRPNGAMRAAMASAEVGDDVFRDDPTIHELGLDN